ncbi:MAG: BapA/Bap/LapF family prefix-like domain-containing protein [Bacillota bacterium]
MNQEKIYKAGLYFKIYTLGVSIGFMFSPFIVALIMFITGELIIWLIGGTFILFFLGLKDLKKTISETVTSITLAGDKLIISYFSLEKHIEKMDIEAVNNEGNAVIIQLKNGSKIWVSTFFLSRERQAQLCNILKKFIA